MDENDWTPWIGWRKAILQIAIRLPLALASSWAGFWFLYVLARLLGGKDDMLIGISFILIPASVFGVLAGKILSRNFSESTGISSFRLLWPTCILFVAGLYAIYLATSCLLPEWNRISLRLFAITGAISLGTAIHQFIVDS